MPLSLSQYPLTPPSSSPKAFFLIRPLFLPLGHDVMSCCTLKGNFTISTTKLKHRSYVHPHRLNNETPNQPSWVRDWKKATAQQFTLNAWQLLQFVVFLYPSTIHFGEAPYTINIFWSAFLFLQYQITRKDDYFALHEFKLKSGMGFAPQTLNPRDQQSTLNPIQLRSWFHYVMIHWPLRSSRRSESFRLFGLRRISKENFRDERVQLGTRPAQFVYTSRVD
ncbi:hypothetical protein PSTT_09508 [Puccinia striiformis]|uniref:Uncharacterized protein n=1 Tax=Puccinia striiformis TaxID=27350 RepID=A0A2S4V8C2_9BASI|nr:hypothetical protein PSTT_09508 [Puccinia striiformis]